MPFNVLHSATTTAVTAGATPTTITTAAAAAAATTTTTTTTTVSTTTMTTTSFTICVTVTMDLTKLFTSCLIRLLAIPMQFKCLNTVVFFVDRCMICLSSTECAFVAKDGLMKQTYFFTYSSV